MKDLLIIGNGFDLHCGLKSKYSNFYQDVIKGRYNYIDFNKANDFWQRLLSTYETKSGNYNWCDIEKIIENNLFNIFYGTSQGHSVLDRVWRNRSSMNMFSEKEATPYFLLCYCTLYLRNHKEYVRIINNSDEIPRWFKLDETPQWLKDDFSEHLIHQLKMLEMLFCKYLKDQIANNKQYKENSLKLFLEITELENTISVNNCLKLSEITKRHHFGKKHLLNFNYTMPLEINELGSNHNVHGRLCNNSCGTCENSTLIFGIDDKAVRGDGKKKEQNEQNECKNLRFFSKTYRTLFSENNIANIIPRYEKNNQLTVKFFGHSLNEADYSYFQSIFDYYNIYESGNVSLIFFYTSFKERAKNEITDAVYNLINQYGLTLTNKEQGKNLMHKLILEKRVKIKEIQCAF